MINLFYAVFLVFLTPLGIPLAYLSIENHLVHSPLIIFCIVTYIMTGLGVGIGYHRLGTHRSFETKPWLKTIFLILGAMAMQGPPAAWASLHIQHHAHSDTVDDPHSPNNPAKNFWTAHCGWIFYHYKPNFRKYGKWLLRDKPIMQVSKYYHYYALLGLLIPTVLFGWVGFVWGGLIRLFITSHATWAVNSVCHRFGSQPYVSSTHDNSRNNVWVTIFSLGEGWHNNHHYNMQSAYFGEHWYQFDLANYTIMILRKLRLCWNVKRGRHCD